VEPDGNVRVVRYIADHMGYRSVWRDSKCSAEDGSRKPAHTLVTCTRKASGSSAVRHTSNNDKIFMAFLSPSKPTTTH
jgi:hypothetical protein